MTLGKLQQKYAAVPVQIKASLWFLICFTLQKGISVITTPIFTRLLSTAEYGAFSVFNSWLGIILIFVTLKLFAGVYQQGLIKFSEESDVYSSSLQGLTLTLVIAWTIVYLLFHSFWNRIFSLTTVQMLAMLLLIWTSSVFEFWTGEQRVKLNYGSFVALTLAVTILKPVVGIFFVTHAKDKVTARILGLALVELIGYTGLFIAQMKRGKTFFHAKYWKYALCFNLPLVPHYLSQTVLNSADRIMIRDMVNESAAGIYSLAYSVSLFLTILNSALCQTLSPWTYQKLKYKKEDEIAPVVYISLIFVAFADLFFIAFAPEIVKLFAPKSYYDAIWIIPAVTMSVYFMFLYEQFVMIELYYEQTRFMMVASMAAAITNVILNSIFIKIYGYYAAGFTTLLCYILFTAAHFCVMKKMCNKNSIGKRIYSGKKILEITIAFLAMGFLMIFVYRSQLIRYIVIAGMGIITFVQRKHFMYLIDLVIHKGKV